MAVRTALSESLRGRGVVRGHFSAVLELVAYSSFALAPAHWPEIDPAEPR
jgi:hypothetical protein